MRDKVTNRLPVYRLLEPFTQVSLYGRAAPAKQGSGLKRRYRSGEKLSRLRIDGLARMKVVADDFAGAG